MQTDSSITTVVITGAAGFIGSHLVDHYLELGATVYAIDNLLTGRMENLTQAQSHYPEVLRFINADASQPVESYLPSGVIPDLVLHFASPASPPIYQKHPIATYQVNVWGVHHWLTFLQEHAPSAQFVYASTSEVYGDPEQHPQTESYWGNVNPNGIRSCYDEAKRMGETICGVFARDFGLNVKIVRIFNTYGPRINPIDGRIIPNFVTQALAGEPLTIYGDGSQTRSYCYVSDLVAGIVAVAASPAAVGQTINLGNPEEKTVLETAEAVLHAFGKTASDETIMHKPLPGDDPTRRKPDITKAQQLLGWQPTVSFEEGVARTIESFEENP